MPESNLDRWARQVEEQSKGSIAAGLGLAFLFHVSAVVVMFIIATVTPDEQGMELLAFSLMYLGLFQLLYMIPAILISRGRGSTETAKGLIIGASITFLLNAACSGLVLGQW